MRFSVLATLLVAMPLLASAAPPGIVAPSELLAARQGSGNDGCYTWSYCDYQNDCFNLCKCNKPAGAPCTNPHPTDPTIPHYP
ncbi:hypothetical protein BCV69DRAFT_299413 [Microstroma glucosiphilum]|uniref:Uncharacterized protein n=1 Tax=Pseudomicrostroma glucosiphilum TaxID=1684307 RepID=A0A316UB82_9BASI|nr:hypothetical protein BCV69DRAFT_299413 [Pseudomicrostroma glucosiphilum]PWN20275.1 hypothetical protein BCV69DRAFT_299413 [Pseudomicrostroma glucosiphilum]